MGIAHGDVWLVRMDPAEGNGIRKTRPCVVVSPDELNESLRSVIIVPITSTPKSAGSRIAIDLRERRGFACLDQIRTVTKERFLRKLGTAQAVKTTHLGFVANSFY